MKKWIVGILVGVVVSGSVSAGWCSVEPDGKNSSSPSRRRQERGCKEADKQKHRSEKKEYRKAIKTLAEAARVELDEVKKTELINQLRSKLIEDADRMHVEFRKRLKQAEANMESMKARLADAVTNRTQKVEERLQKLLSCEVSNERSGRSKLGKRSKGKCKHLAAE